MLNRLFIIVGLLAILAIGAAFIVPRFIAWDDYRGRIQAIGSEVLGAPVTIVGDIEFALLPQPQVLLSNVVVGPPGHPAISIGRIEAQLSLVDFIRDKYAITKLVLERPVLSVAVDAAGAVDTGLKLAEQVSASNVSVANALIVDGRVEIADARTSETFATDNINGELRLEALRGPFAFQGTGEYGGDSYGLRLTTALLAEDGTVKLSGFARQGDGDFSIGIDGVLQTGATPSYVGTVTYRQTPPAPANPALADAGRGDLLLSGKVEATPARILFSDYTLTPDENRGATRLQGAAEIRLGRDRDFNAVISGGMLALPPRDATAEEGVAPYEVLRLLAELPVPPIPALPGTIGVDIGELDLRTLSLRNVRLDATAGAQGWTIERFSAQLPGGARLFLAGHLAATAGRPEFLGTLSLNTEQLSTLAALWRKPASGNPLLNMPGSLDGDLSLVGETLSFSEGVLTLDGLSHAVSAEIGFSPATRHLNFKAGLGAMTAADSAALVALLPELGQDPGFGVSFPKGRFDVAAENAVLAGLDGTGLVARGSWEGGVIVVDQLAATDLGGTALDLKLTAFGSLAQPELSGSGTIKVRGADSAALTLAFDAAGVPVAARGLLERSLPADLALRLDAPSGDGGQMLSVSGRVGAAELAIDAQLGLGFVKALGGPLSIKLDARSADPRAMTSQLGLGELSLVPESGPMHLVAVIQGTASNSFESTLLIEGGGDSLGFAGNIVVNDPEAVSGNGTVKIALSDPSGLLESLGVGGVAVPGVNGSAELDFVGAQNLHLKAISGQAGGETLSGELMLTHGAVSGNLAIGKIDPAGLLTALAGPASLLGAGDGRWPDGPFDLGSTARATSGRVAVTTPEITLGGGAAISDARFDLVWDAQNVRLRNLGGSVGGGKLALELGLCCAGALPEKRLNGRLTLTDVNLDAVATPAIAAALDGRLDGTAQFDGTGDSVEAALRTMTGEGSFSVRDLRVERLNPGAFDSVGGLKTVLDLAPEALSAQIVDRLDDAAFTAPSVNGGFTIAGGVFRSPNMAIEGAKARLFGDVTLNLADLTLGGSYAMSPLGPGDPDALLNPASAEITAKLAGTLPVPQRSFDVSAMVDGIMVRAYELEVARLEELRAADEARQREAAAERARIIAAQEAAKKAEEDAAAKKAADETAAKKASDDAAAQAAAGTPLQLDLPPSPPGF